jgi:hypothetical protein
VIRGSRAKEAWGRGVHLEGGGLAVFRSCAIEGNEGAGVALEDGAAALLEACSIRGNSGPGLAGGEGCEATLTSCLVAGNGSTVAGPRLTLTNCTIAGNAARLDCPAEGSLVLTNCIAWGNGDPPAGPIGFPLGTCRLERCCLDATDVPAAAGLLFADPRFLRPGDFDLARVDAEGWPDFIVDPGDYHLDPASPCIDTGTGTGAPPADLDGSPTGCGAGVDIGAYERPEEVCTGGAPRFRRGRVDPDGILDLADPIFLLLHLFLGGGPPPCLDAADIDDGGSLDLTDAVLLLGYLFLGGAPPAAPFAACGSDPSPDGLDCREPPSCR